MKEFELEPGEHIVLEARKHWFFFAVELLPYALLTLIPFSIPHFLVIAPPLAAYAPFFAYHDALGRAFLGVWLLVTWTSAWGVFTRYFLNAWVLTSERIVDIKQEGFFHREVSSLFLSRVQDVTTDVEGILPSLLGMGDITVQSAGAVDEFHMQGIPTPEKMRDVILRYTTLVPKDSSV